MFIIAYGTLVMLESVVVTLFFQSFLINRKWEGVREKEDFVVKISKTRQMAIP